MALSRCFKLYSTKMGKSQLTVEGTGVGIYTPLQKLAVGARGARKLRANVRILWTLGSGHSRLREIY
jgi:hypothetical protein